MLRRSLVALSSKIPKDGPAPASASRWRPPSRSKNEDLRKSVSFDGVVAAVAPTSRPRFTIGRDQFHFLLYILPAGLVYVLYVRKYEEPEEQKHALLEQRYGDLVRHSKDRRQAFDKHFKHLEAERDDLLSSNMDDLLHAGVRSKSQEEVKRKPKVRRLDVEAERFAAQAPAPPATVKTGQDAPAAQ
ncbi:hypothetical protein JKP88DRAFT_349820 [Tribonema minus]|uniref:Uncharacterized protein n=1 Tax=Tribonema minus TaxID=303371 RepID=A0A836CAW6_9STRA|nr:hypothetical protein JKP88DRAFT_349820 [Tribonema minus]